ncbi:hypothetical protein [Cyanobium sp. Morenito 9A2]|uniref:hypothetical protein n=1 Tax=Cyanobium sp. Morenito 9A2 TaxID=2823718 RepID=UPI0020CD7CA7|nr:hypothetical protein [Cyanobium sp. Morenito 9A2]MCP9850018.1 hypothetical protein [Cyanobium sp. Morenito 9A2]
MLSGVQDRIKPLKAWLFPPRVLLELEDRWLTLSAFPSRGKVHRATVLQRVPLPAGSIVAGEPRRNEAIGDLIGDLLLEHGLNGARIVATLPHQATQWRLVQWATPGWPANAEKELEDLNPDLGLSYPLKTAYVTLLPLGRSDSRDPASSLLVTVRRAAVQAWIDIFTLAGVELERLESAQLSEWRALDPLLKRVPSGGLFVQVDLYESGSRVVLYSNGVPEYEQALPVAGRPVQADLNRELVQRVEAIVRYWREQEPGLTSVQLGLVGSYAERQDLVDLFRRSEAWSLESVDVFKLGWIVPPGTGGETPLPNGSQLLRVAGLLQEEINP